MAPDLRWDILAVDIAAEGADGAEVSFDCEVVGCVSLAI